MSACNAIDIQSSGCESAYNIMEGREEEMERGRGKELRNRGRVLIDALLYKTAIPVSQCTVL